MFENFMSRVRSSSDNGDEGPHSCNYCQQIVLREDFDEDLWNAGNSWMNLTFNLTLKEFRIAIDNNCLLCQAICQGEEIPTHLQDDLVLAASFNPHMLNPGQPDQLGPFGLVDIMTKTIKHGFKKDFKTLVRAVPNDPAATHILTRPINDDPSTIRSWRLVRDWLDECLQNHDECKARLTKFMPTRLLEICHEDPNHLILRLRRKDEIAPVSYTALSYCWGEDGNIPITTKASLEVMESGISLEMLPRTIKDAILVTHNLNMKYIWIDSLCIIQDLTTEKRQEISKMPKIYGEATLVLAASRSKDASTGFLQPRKQFHATEFQVPFRLFNNDMGSVILHDKRRERSNATEPLDTRGWAMQERLLATRIVEYGTLQTRWTCLGNRRGYSDGWVEGEESSWGRYNLSDTRLFPSPNRTLKDLSLSDLAVSLDWYTLLWHYTHRDLTVNSDRLLAASGIVQEFSKAAQEEYLAGLWKTLLPDDLLWSIHRDRRCPRPTEFQAPSWSWAAVNGPMFPRVEDEVGKECCLTFISASVVPEDDDLPHGAVSSGRIVIRGKTKSAKWNPQPIAGRSRLRQARMSTIEHPTTIDDFSRGHDVLPFKVLDDCIELEDTHSKWMPVTLLIGRCDDRPCPEGYSGLILKHVKDTTYTRVGKFIFIKPDHESHDQTIWHEEEPWEQWATWFNDATEQELALE